MNKTLKISLISVGLIGSALGVYYIIKRNKMKGGGNVSYENDSFPLKLNSGGDRVKQLQSFLNNQGSYGLDVDGKFGPLTLQAVKNEQSPLSDFKISFPNAVFGEVSQEYYNTFIVNQIVENSSQAENSTNLTNIVPTGGGNSSLQYAIDPSTFAFNGNDWN
jgi:peptidoglycan hydrolase-like protein with peptidoglycan-binding domain